MQLFAKSNMAELKNTIEGLVLTDGVNSLCADFSKLKKRIRPHALNRELIVRAAKIKGNPNPVVMDATAGLGEDSFLLAAAGCTVMLYERDEIIAALLRDGLRRAMADGKLAEIAKKMELIEADSIAAMESAGEAVDIIYLDPMFPERTKSALVKKKFQLLQQLESPCSDEEELLMAALSAGPQKIIIKRPAKGSYLAGRKPSYSIEGKTVRYDCII